MAVDVKNTALQQLTTYAKAEIYPQTLCSNDRASLISKYNRNQPDATNSDLFVINSISTCFGHLYAHHQEIRLRSTAYSCLSCCSCCDAGESGGKMCALCGECCR